MMRRLKVRILAVAAVMAAAVQLVQPVGAAGNADNFVFESFTGDYTLFKDAEGVSRLRIVETLVAEFPNYDQNHGIVRRIPYTNLGGSNMTSKNKQDLNVAVTRNGVVEPFDLEREDGDWILRIGSVSEYVLGKQTYVISYEMQRVVTEFDGYQELYWNANGTRWGQPFGQVTAYLTVEDAEVARQLEPSEAWCYVGKYGSSGQERCEITSMGEGKWKFSTSNLTARENLTFDIKMPEGSFVVPEPEKNYIMLVILAVEVTAITVISIVIYKKFWRPVAEKYNWYKTAPVAPQYQPAKGFTVGEVAEVYLEPTRNPKVATLLELIVAEKISIKKLEDGGKIFKRKRFAVVVDDLEGLSGEQLAAVEIITWAKKLEIGVEYEVKRHRYDAEMEKMFEEYDTMVERSLKRKGAYND